MWHEFHGQIMGAGEKYVLNGGSELVRYATYIFLTEFVNWKYVGCVKSCGKGGYEGRKQEWGH